MTFYEYIRIGEEIKCLSQNDLEILVLNTPKFLSPSLGLVWAKTDGKSIEVLGWGDQPHIELEDLPEKTKEKLLKLISEYNNLA